MNRFPASSTPTNLGTENCTHLDIGSIRNGSVTIAARKNVNIGLQLGPQF